MSKRVVVLLSTYNGEKYLKEQLNSIFEQTYEDIQVFARDDGSSDSTCDILEEYSRKYNLNWHSGENIGFALSFMQLLYTAPDADYYAFCDQDDIWHSDKIETAVLMIEKIDSEKCLLYVSNQRYINMHGEILEKRFHQIPNTKYDERFMRGYFSGCTMVLNNSLKSILTDKKNQLSNEFIKERWHDSWVLLVCLFIGNVIYDAEPHMYYRRHDENSSEISGGILCRFLKVPKFLFKKNSRKNLRNITAQILLDLFENQMDVEKKIFLQNISQYRETYKKRLRLAFNYNIPLTSPESRIEFIVKVLFGWL